MNSPIRPNDLNVLKGVDAFEDEFVLGVTPGRYRRDQGNVYQYDAQGWAPEPG